MTLFNFLPGRKQCKGVMHVKNHFGNPMYEMKCILPWGHEGPHMNNQGSWFNWVAQRDELSKRVDNPAANSSTGRNDRRYFILGPDGSLKKKE